jgi:hypothetical protein
MALHSERVQGEAVSQGRLSFDPPSILVAVPPQCPPKVHKLKPAALNVLELLRCGPGPYLWHQLMAVGGSRYSARVGELRAAGYAILGPLGWTRPDGTRETRTVPLRNGQECYRLVQQ